MEISEDAAANGIKYFEVSIDPYKFISKVGVPQTHCVGLVVLQTFVAPDKTFMDHKYPVHSTPSYKSKYKCVQRSSCGRLITCHHHPEMQKAASVASMLVLIFSTSCANLWAVHVQNSGWSYSTGYGLYIWHSCANFYL